MTRRGDGTADGPKSPDAKPTYTAEEVETLTRRADELLRQLHDVLGEISVHLQAVGKGGGK